MTGEKPTQYLLRESREAKQKTIQDLPRFGLLMSALKLGRLTFLSRLAPQDFESEAFVFLQARDPEETPEEFSREAQKYFYDFAKRMGYRRPKNSIGYDLTAINETDVGAPLESVKVTKPDAENVIEIKEYRDIINELFTPKEVAILKAFVYDVNSADTRALYGMDTYSEHVEILQKMIERLQTQVGIEIPEVTQFFPRVGKQTVGKTVRTPSEHKRVFVSPEMRTLTKVQLAEILGVSEATAARAKKSGYTSLGYHESGE